PRRGAPVVLHEEIRLLRAVVRIEERVRARDGRRVAEQERRDAVAARAGAVVGERGRERDGADRGAALELTEAARDEPGDGLPVVRAARLGERAADLQRLVDGDERQERRVAQAG